MYNPLMYNPLNAWFAFSTQPVRVWTAMLRGIAEGMAKDDAENDRTAADNVIDAEARFSESASRPKRRVAAAAVQAKLDELIRVSAAHNALIGIEHLTEDEISEIREKCLARVKKSGNGAQKNANKKARAAVDKTV